MKGDEQKINVDIISGLLNNKVRQYKSRPFPSVEAPHHPPAPQEVFARHPPSGQGKPESSGLLH